MERDFIEEYIDMKKDDYDYELSFLMCYIYTKVEYFIEDIDIESEENKIYNSIDNVKNYYDVVAEIGEWVKILNNAFESRYSIDSYAQFCCYNYGFLKKNIDLFDERNNIENVFYKWIGGCE